MGISVIRFRNVLETFHVFSYNVLKKFVKRSFFLFKNIFKNFLEHKTFLKWFMSSYKALKNDCYLYYVGSIVKKRLRQKLPNIYFKRTNKQQIFGKSGKTKFSFTLEMLQEFGMNNNRQLSVSRGRRSKMFGKPEKTKCPFALEVIRINNNWEDNQ